MVITPGPTLQPRYVGLSVVPTHIDHWSLAAAPIRIGRLVAFAPAVGDAGIPFVKGHREPADREWSRKRHAMLWAFNVNAIPFAFRRAHGEAASRNYHHLGAFGAIPECLAQLVSAIRRRIGECQRRRYERERRNGKFNLELMTIAAANIVGYGGSWHSSPIRCAATALPQLRGDRPLRARELDRRT